MPRLLIANCPLSASYRCTLTIDGRRYWSVLHYYFCEKYNWRDAFPNRETKHYYELLLQCDNEETVVMLGRKLPRLRRKFKTLVNLKKPELGTVDNALKLDALRIPNWESVKYDVMLRALRTRLEKPEIRQALHKTHNAMLIYRPLLMLLRVPPGSTWGTPGVNQYGRMLMLLRREIKCESDGVLPSIEPKVPIVIDWNGVEHDKRIVKRQ